MQGVTSILVTGAGGRIGRVLRRLWHDEDLRPRWIGRNVVGDDVLAANILCDDVDPGHADVVLALAGVVRGDAAALALNTDLALAGQALARRSGARAVLVASSGAVYGPGTGLPLAEDDALSPVGGYGAAKVAMEQALLAAPHPGLSILRIGNIAGLDALLGGNPPGQEVTLDPVPDQPGGPLRSYIGVATLAAVLAALCRRAAAGGDLPRLLNIAAHPALPMADLLQADGRRWRYGPQNPAVVPSVVLDTTRLTSLLPDLDLHADAARMVAEWRAVTGGQE